MRWHPMQWRLCACPACGGDLYQEALEDESFSCLQCGRDIDAEQSLRQPTPGDSSPFEMRAESLLGELWDQRLSAEARSALWSRLVVETMLDRQRTTGERGRSGGAKARRRANEPPETKVPAEPRRAA